MRTSRPGLAPGLSASWTIDAITMTIGDVAERVTAGFVTPGTFSNC